MGDLKIKKVCGFNISSIHFSMMILPYINKELEKEKKIITFLEGNLEKNIKEILSKITLNNEAKDKIMKLNWNGLDIEKINIEKYLKTSFTNEKDLCFIVFGREKYINIVNTEIRNFINKYEKNINKKNIKIIDCYCVEDFNENIREILDEHDMMFNTSGEHKIEDIFENYHLA